MVDVESEGKGFSGEEELVRDGSEEVVGLLADLLGLHYFGSRLAETIEIVAKIEMEGSVVFVSFNCLIFVGVLSTLEAVEGGGGAVLAGVDLSVFVHFSIKIIKLYLINSS